MVGNDQYTRSVSDAASAGKRQFSVGEPFRSHNKFNNLHIPISLARCNTLPHIQTGKPIKITWPAKMLVGLIAYHQGKENQCFASLPILAAELGTSVDTVGLALDVLVNVGLVRRRRRPNRTSICELIWHPVLGDSLKNLDSADLRNPNNQPNMDSAELPVRIPQIAGSDSVNLRNPYKEEEIQEESQVRESSSSSGSSEQLTLPDEDDDDFALQNFLRDWMRGLHPYQDFPLPPKAVIKEIRRESPGWTDEQRMEGYRQNALIRKPNPKAPPNGYGYFVIVMRNLYAQCAGVPPDLPPIPKQQEKTAEYSAPVAAAEPPKATGCAYCKSSGRLSEGGGYCNRCECGPELKQREAEERATRQAFEVENATRSKQNDEWVAIRKYQPANVQRRMDYGDLSEAFLVATVAKREEILKQMRQGKYPWVVPRIPMAGAVGQNGRRVNAAS